MEVLIIVPLILMTIAIISIDLRLKQMVGLQNRYIEMMENRINKVE